MTEPPVVDLRSDTVTRPSPATREAIAGAEVGDDALGGDPTTRRLEVVVAELLGKERALFFPTGLMANQTALAVLGRWGGEVVVEADSHVLNYEDGAAGALSGIQLRSVPTPDGLLTPALLGAAIRPPSRYLPRTCAVALENTHAESAAGSCPSRPPPKWQRWPAGTASPCTWTARASGTLAASPDTLQPTTPVTQTP